MLPRLLLAGYLFLHTGALAWTQPSPHVAQTDPLPPEQQRAKFRLPPGFEIQLVAAEPQINKPMNIAFDAKGRLWVTGSVEYPYPAKGKGRDKVWVLDDFAVDGRARSITTFADGLNIPIGVLPTAQGAIVFSIPNIYHLVDTDGDGKADRRDVLFSGYGYGDTHGMTGEFVRGFDGWIYACHGFANKSAVSGKGPAADGPDKIAMHSGNTYRFKPDGSRIEYFTHGQVNPFGLAFDAAGNLYSCDCHSRPIYHLLKGAWYPSFEKPHDGLGFGPEMLRHSHGSTAIAGIACYEADAFPSEYRGNIFIGNVVTNRINRDRVEWTGATPQAVEMPDFVACDDPWFRPVDIKLGPDGALYVADFYNRIIGHYEVPLDHPGRDREKGRIWRIVYRGENKQIPIAKIDDLTKLPTPDLVGRLNSTNLAVRMQATQLLVERGGNNVIQNTRGLLERTTDYPAAHALWVLERLGALQDKDLARALSASWNLIRIHAARILAERGQWGTSDRELALLALRDAAPQVKRAAVEALGAHPRPENIPLLLRLLHDGPRTDTHLTHVLRMALRDQLKPADAWAKLGRLNDKDSRAVADVCTGLRSRESGEFLLGHLASCTEDTRNWTRYAQHVARYVPPRDGADSPFHQALKLVRAKADSDLGVQAAVFKAAFQGLQERGGTPGGDALGLFEDLTHGLLASANPGQQQVGVELAGLVRLKVVAGQLRVLARNPANNEGLRKSAVQALGAIEPAGEPAFFAALLAGASEPFAVREQAALVLGGSGRPEGREHLLKALPTAPARLERSIALALASSRDGAARLLDAVAEGKASARLLQDGPLVARLRDAQIADLNARLKKLTAGLPAADQRIQQLLNKRRDAFRSAQTDALVGAKVFEKSCAICHQLNNQGSKIGPQLDGIGIRGLERLLEDVLDPNRNVDQAFRTTTLTLKNGQFINGLLLRQEGKILILADAQGKEMRIDTDAVESRALSPLSPMPAALSDQIPDGDFHHLMGFLLSQTANKKR